MPKEISIKKHPISKRSPDSPVDRIEVGPSFPTGTVIAVLVIILLVVGGYALWNNMNKPGVTQAKTAAVVNGEAILWSDIDKKYDAVPANLRENITKDVLLNQTINDLLLKQEIANKKIMVDKKEVGSIINSIKSQFSTEQQFNNTLSAQGMTYGDFVSQLELRLQLNKLIQQEIPAIRVTDTEIRDFFDKNKDRLGTPKQVHAFHILVNSSQQALGLIDRINRGEDFSALAKQYSLDTGSANLGGDLGYFSAGSMVKEFEDVVFGLKVGEVSKPVKTSFGYHIIKLVDIREAKPANYDDLKTVIELNLYNAKVDANKDKVNQYLQGLRSKANIKFGAGVPVANVSKVPSGAAAVVNGAPITWDDIDKKYTAVPAQLRATITKEILLNQTINEMLLKDEIAKQNIAVQKSEITSITDSIKSQFPSQAEFNSALAAQGITFAEFESQLELRLQINRLLEKEVPELAINESEMRNYFSQNNASLGQPEQVRALHILVNTSTEALDILNRIDNGANFSELAKNYSLDTGSAAVGGDLGFFSRDQMVKAFEDAAFSMKIGEVSRPIKTDFGYHIIKVIDRKDPVPADYAKLKTLIELNILNTKLQTNRDQVNAYIESLRSKADIQYP
jgi:foldase protein PrsA